MKISGFTFVRNAEKLFFPIKESILSILPIVDEFVVVVASSEDNTREIVDSIDSDKIKIVDTSWDVQKYPNGTIYAYLTDMAKKYCSGDWLFYLQGDEIVHEKYLSYIKNNCQKYLNNLDVEGFLFQYKHFWGDFDHYHMSHAWYPREIRIIRNDPLIHSWRDAQSFKYYSTNKIDYLQKTGTRKLNVIELDAYIFHYGWVRPPELMKNKMKEAKKIYHKSNNDNFKYFDYGPLNRLKKYKEIYPRVLNNWVQKFNWSSKLQYKGRIDKNRGKHKHERLKYRLLSFLEQTFLKGRLIGGFKNYNKVGKAEKFK